MSYPFRFATRPEYSIDGEPQVQDERHSERLENGWVDIEQELRPSVPPSHQQENRPSFIVAQTYGTSRSIDQMLFDLNLDDHIISGIRQRPEDHLNGPKPFQIALAIHSLLLSHNSHTLARYLRVKQHPAFHFHFIRQVGTILMKINIIRQDTDVTITGSIHARGHDLHLPLTTNTNDRQQYQQQQTAEHLLPAYMTKPPCQDEALKRSFLHAWDVHLKASLAPINGGDLTAPHFYTETYARPRDLVLNRVELHPVRDPGDDNLVRKLMSNLARFFFLVAERGCYAGEQRGGESFVATT